MLQIITSGVIRAPRFCRRNSLFLGNACSSIKEESVTKYEQKFKFQHEMQPHEASMAHAQLLNLSAGDLAVHLRQWSFNCSVCPETRSHGRELRWGEPAGGGSEQAAAVATTHQSGPISPPITPPLLRLRPGKAASTVTSRAASLSWVSDS